MTPLSVAVQAARAAEVILRRNFGRVKPSTIRIKKGGSIVTHVDHEAERTIRRIIRRSYPSHAVLGEEFGHVGPRTGPLWIVDPLDGTTNFTIGSPFFGTMIAVIVNRQIECGVITLPMFHETYIASRGRGARRNGRRIHVSKTSRLDESIVSVGFTHDRVSMRRALAIHGKIFAHVRNVRQFGSGAVSYAYAASGKVEATLIPEPVSRWDVAAGVLLVREAGGTVTDLRGKPWTLRTEEVLASNGRIHAKLLRLIR